MNPETIRVAIREAERFIERARAAEAAFGWHEFTNPSGGFWVNDNTKLTGAARRASMDLTRALADLRRRS